MHSAQLWGAPTCLESRAVPDKVLEQRPTELAPRQQLLPQSQRRQCFLSEHTHTSAAGRRSRVLYLLRSPVAPNL